MGFIQFKSFFFLFVSILIHLSKVSAQPNYAYDFCQGANYTSKSPFQRNLNLTLSSLLSNITTTKKFYTNSIGQNPDRVFAIMLCKGDLKIEACKTCAETAIGDISKRCPGKKEYISWYDDCMLRYSNSSILSVLQADPEISLLNTGSIDNPEPFFRLIQQLMSTLLPKASSDSKFATGELNYTSFQKLYGLVQCTPDISGSDCNRCLTGAVSQLPTCCFGRPGGRVLRPNCNIRYELYPFYELAVTSPTPSPASSLSPPSSTNSTTTGEKAGKSNKSVIIGAVVASVVALVLLSAIVFCIYTRKKKGKGKNTNVGEVETAESLQFDFSTIRAATDNFSDSNNIGEGGFGIVYKGKLPNGEEIAVKRLSMNSGQGLQEFKNEVLLLAKLQHRNLVRLLGFCYKDEEKLLIYQYLPNKSLDHFIFDPVKRAQLSWEKRFKIIEGIARGLLYLHEDSRVKIIHRDLKPNNVLLDEDMNPKISDFGMAKLFTIDQTQGNTSRVVGTYGYMSPEYAMHGQFSVKSDVYSFGILLLEIVSGCRNNSSSNSNSTKDLLSHAWRSWKSGTPLDLIDSTISDRFSRNEVTNCIHIGLLCVQDDAADRPNMDRVVFMLSSYSITLPVPTEPAFFSGSTTQSNLRKVKLKSPHSTETDKSTSTINEVSITELEPR